VPVLPTAPARSAVPARSPSVSAAAVAAPASSQTNPTASVSPSAPASADDDYNPLEILRSVDDGDIALELDGSQGHYGAGIASFDIREGTKFLVHATVRNGMLVPGTVKAEFNPPLHIGTVLNINALDGRLTPEGHLIFDLSHFAVIDAITGLVGVHFNDLTKAFTGLDALPMQLASNGNGPDGLYEVLLKHLGQMEKTAESFLGGKSPAVLTCLHVHNARMRAGALQLPPGMPTLSLGPTNTMNLDVWSNATVLRSGKPVQLPGHVTMVGRVDVPALVSELGDTRLTATGITANANIAIPTDGKGRAIVSLSDVNGRLEKSQIDDGQGTRFTLNAATLTHANITFSSDIAAALKPQLKVSLQGIDTQVSDVSFAVTQPGGARAKVGIAAARFKGDLDLAPGKVHVNMSSTALHATGNNLVLGGGALRIGAAQAQVSGSGLVDYANGVLDFYGHLDLAAQVASGHFDAGAVSAEIAPGTQLNLTLQQLRLGGKTPTFRGSGTLNLTLDGGQIRTPHQVHDIRPGSNATITADKIAVDDKGVSASGSLVIHTQVDGKDPLSVSAAGVRVTAAGDSETLDATAHDFVLDHGALSLGALSVRAKARVTRIAGRLSSSVLASATSTMSAPPIETSPIAMPDMSAVQRPSNAVIADLVKDANATVQHRLVPAHYQLLGHDFLFPATPTLVTMNVKVRDGIIVGDGTNVQFSPPLTLPEIDRLPTAELANFVGLSIPDVQIDSRGHIKVELSLKLPHVHIHPSWKLEDWRVSATMQRVAFDLGPSPVSLKLTDLAQNNAKGIPALPFTLPDLDIAMSEVSLKESQLPLGNGCSLAMKPSALTKLTMHIAANGDITAEGHAQFAASDIAIPGFSAKALRGEADISLKRNAAGDLRATLSNLSGPPNLADPNKTTSAAAQSLRLQSHDDVAAIDNASLQGSLTLITPHDGGSRIDCNLSNVSGSLTPDGSYLLLNSDQQRSAAHLRSGKLWGGQFAFASDGPILASGTISDVKGDIEALPIALGGMALDVSKASLSIPSGTFNLKNGVLAFSGGIDAEADIASGRFGAEGTAFNLDIDRGTSARLHFDNLVVGNAPAETRVIKGSGHLVFNLKGGQIRIPDPRGGKRPAIVVRVIPGATGRIDLSTIERTAGHPFGKVRGTLAFHGKLEGKLPKGGVQAGPLSINSVDTNRESVEVSVGGLAMENDGQFALGNVTLTENTDASGIAGTLAPLSQNGTSAEWVPPKKGKTL
jgi:hypothetical protein